MNKKLKWVICLSCVLSLMQGAYSIVLADREEHKERKRHQEVFDRDHDDDDDNDDHRDGKGLKSDGEHYLNPVDNAQYKETCGACHFAYQPGLLPSGSWEKILAGLDDHFGEAIELDIESKKIIDEYLKANACERSTAKRSVKIMKSLGNKTPLRITDIRYIQDKHHEVPADVFKRKAIGSLSNCSACHTTAERGIYEDDYVIIPK